ncbi:MAG: hypothetical protein HQL88_10195 [Magnetococcales bacterium]|nr:hypothetical protein [Magnetococcales bacterium]
MKKILIVAGAVILASIAAKPSGDTQARFHWQGGHLPASAAIDDATLYGRMVDVG